MWDIHEKMEEENLQQSLRDLAFASIGTALADWPLIPYRTSDSNVGRKTPTPI